MSDNKQASCSRNPMLWVVVVLVGVLLWAFYLERLSKYMPSGAGSADVVLKKVSDQLKQKPMAVNPTPVKGLFEVQMAPGQIFYMTGDGKYVFVGSLVNAETRENLTQKASGGAAPSGQPTQAGVKPGGEAAKVEFATLPLKDAIKVVKGTGSRQFAVFTDPDCPYCKKFEQKLADSKETNYTMYVFAFPLSSIHPDARRKVDLILCSKEPGKAWSSLMLGGQEPAGAAKCDTSAIDRTIKLGETLGVAGTPTIVTMNNERIVGAVDTATLFAGMPAKK